ncbi:tyrosine-type recombinase/integrase [Aliarcobacter butzleri]|jgi:integrase|uniref:tyrosine-type recombinase/integrase n=1 Tax=Aliarcobacter butzleri TaxID=28197 RepID=UPI003AF4D86D
MNEEELSKNFNKNLTIFKTDTSINIQSENDEEKSLIEDITQKTIRSIKKRAIKKIQSNIEIKSSRTSKNNIKKHINLYIKYLKLTNKNEKTTESYIKKFDLLIEYFNHIKVYNLIDITKKQCKDLQLYLLNFPSNLNKYEELKNKNIFELIDKEDKILEKYDKLDKRTVDNYITRYKTLFNYFLDNDYVYTNYFLTIKNLKSKNNNSIKEFLNKEDTYSQFEKFEIEQLINNIEDREIKNLIIISIISGMRISEILNLKINDIIKYNYTYLLNITKSKTKNGIRKIPLKFDFNFIIDEQKQKKKNEDFLFFNEEKEKNRNDKIQKRVMYQIRKFIKEDKKVFHSFRKNFTQLLYKNEIEELYIKILLGHSLKDNLSFNVYNLSKIDNQTLINEIEKIDFKELFINTEYFKKTIKSNDKNISYTDLNINF